MATANPPKPLARRVLSPYALLLVSAAVAPFVIWPGLLTRATSTNFLPHRYCYLGDPALVWTNVVSDGLIGAAYIAISASLAYLVHRARRDIPFSWMFLAFGLFIVACGGTHIMEVVTVWKPLYWLSADVKILTAVASIATAVVLPLLVPKTLSLLTESKVSAERKSQLEAVHSRMRELDRLSVRLAAQNAAGLAQWEWDLTTGEIRWWGDVRDLFCRDPYLELAKLDQVIQVIHPDDRRRVEALLSEAVTARREYDAEFRVVCPDGTVRWLIGRGHVHREEDGKPVSIIGVNMDITSRKRSEAALQQSEKLAVAGRLAASIAHEINNPLGAVTNLLYLIQTHAKSDDDIQKYAAEAQDELTRVAHIVRQTLGFYRDPGKTIPIRLDEVLQNVIALHTTEIRAKHLGVEPNYIDGARAYGRAGEIRQVFANLLRNAIEASPERSVIRVRMRPAGIDGRRAIRVDITNSGNGVPRQVRRQLFEPFVTTKGAQGTGLGLWITRNIIEKHGGRIWFRSVERFGTVFSVVLPVPEEAPPAGN